MDPKRWIDDADAPPGVREALRGAMRARPLEAETRARVGARVARVAALPVTLATLLSVKSAAAVGVGVGLLTASVSVGIFEYTERSQPAETARKAPEPSLPRSPRRTGRAEKAVVAEPPAPPATASSAPAAPTPIPVVTPKASAAGGLAEESRLLESARRSLDGSPAEALARVREHESRFPRGKLASERNLLELEALYRLGRHGEARGLAQRLLAQGGDDLYTSRIRRLLSKIERSK